MDNKKIDPSLAEVREWRRNLQKEFSHLDPAAEIEETHRRAQEFMDSRGLKMKLKEAPSRQKA